MQTIIKEYVVQFQREDQTSLDHWNHGMTLHTLERAMECAEDYFALHRSVRVVEKEIRVRYAKWK